MTESLSISSGALHIRLLARLLANTSLVTAVVHRSKELQQNGINKENSNNNNNSNGTITSSTNGHQKEVINGNPDSRSMTDRLPSNGILVGLNYKICSVEKVNGKLLCASRDVNDIIPRLYIQVDTLANESVNLVRLKCPYGRQGVNTSDWSRQSKCWEQVSTSEKDRLGRDHLGDGEFYLSFVDFVQTFTSLECVHLDAETSRDEPTLQGKGMWIRSFSILYGQITIFYINISVS